MAGPYHVDDARPDDTGDGLSWATAKKTLAAGIALCAAGERLYVKYTHDETVASSGGNAYIAFPYGSNPVEVFSVDADYVYRRGASWTFDDSSTTSDVVIGGSFAIHGLNIVNQADALFLGASFYQVWLLDDVIVQFGQNVGSLLTLYTAQGYSQIRNSTIECLCASAYTQKVGLAAQGAASIVNTIFTGANWFIRLGGSTGTNMEEIEFIGCDFSGCMSGSPVLDDSTGNTRIQMNGCRMPDSWTAPVPSSFNVRMITNACTDATHSTAVRGLSMFSLDAVAIHDEAVTHAGGASMSETGSPLYTEKITISNTTSYYRELVRPFKLPSLSKWVTDGGPQVVTIHVASSIPLNAREVWIDVFSPSEEVTATSLVKFRSTRDLVEATTDLDGTAAVLADGISGDWTGSGWLYVYELSVTIAPAIPGPLYAIVNVAKYYATGDFIVWVDPKIFVT